MERVDLNIELHAKQSLMYMTSAQEVFFGGAAGPGKSYGLRACAVIYCSLIGGLQVFFFRRSYPDLIKSHVEGPKGLRSMLAPLVRGGSVEIVEGEVRFWNGSKIFLCHCKDEDDKYNYLSSEIHLLCIDELTTFTETIYRFLRSRVRCVGLSIPEEFRGMFPRILCASNPANIGHQWVKRTFIDPASPGKIWRASKEEGGMLRQFIPAKLDDNPSLKKDDPFYENRLSGLGSPRLVQAYREGRWDIMEGSFFPEFGDSHIIEPFKIPEHWTKFRAFDWGSRSPFYCGWYAVVSEDYEVVRKWDGVKIVVSKDAIIQYREWNGEREYNVGLGYNAEEIAAGILQRDALAERIDYSIADTSIFDEDGGPSIAERMRLKGVIFLRADKRRIPGWDTVRQRLVGVNGKPMLYFFCTCSGVIRDLPSIQHSEKKMEDAESEGVADHSVDSLRYGCMSRPYSSQLPESKIVKDIHNLTFDDLWKYQNIFRC